MKFKVCLMLATFLVATNCDVFAYAYSFEKTPSGKVVRPAKKQTSSIVRSSIHTETDIADYNAVISELQKRISENPDDYSILVPLVDAYIRVKKYENAYADLEYLNSLKNANKLSQNIINNIDKLRLKTIERTKYVRNKSTLYVDIALMNLICSNISEAELYIKKASSFVTNPALFVNALKLVFDNTSNYENGISICNAFLLNNQVGADVKREINKLKAYFYTNLGKYEDALKEQLVVLSSGNYNKETIYETYKLLVRTNASDDKIIKTLFFENSKNKEQCYYDLYNLLVEFNDYEGAVVFADKLEKQYPNALSTAFIKAERLLNEGHVNEVIEVLNAVSDKLTRDEDIAIFNRLMASISRTPDKEALKLFNQGYPDKALELLEGKNIPQTPNILAFKARCCMELNRMNEALDYLNRAVSLDSENLFVNLQFGNYYYAVDDYAMSRKYAEKCLQLDSSNEFAIQLIDVLNEIDAANYISQIKSTYEAQNYKETTRLINEAIKVAPNSAILFFYQGLTHIAESNFAASTASLYKSLELDSSNIYAYYYLAIAFDNLAEYENAYGYYVQFLQLLPKDQFGESDKIEHAKSRINKLQTLL